MEKIYSPFPFVGLSHRTLTNTDFTIAPHSTQQGLSYPYSVFSICLCQILEEMEKKDKVKSTRYVGGEAVDDEVS